MALEGTLKDFSLADIFQLIGLQRKTGVLTLRGKDAVEDRKFRRLRRYRDSRLSHQPDESNRLRCHCLSARVWSANDELAIIAFEAEGHWNYLRVAQF